MYKIPLFPLNTVLFPGAPVYLHIFEERYKLMINHCIDNREPFGVVLIKSGQEAYGAAEPYEVGCSADIVQVQRLEQERMQIDAIGKERLKIQRHDHDLPYLQGWVEDIDITPPQSNVQLARSAAHILPCLQKYINVLQEVHNVEAAFDQFPDNPLELGYLAAHILQIAPEKKQEMLEESDAQLLLDGIYNEYRHEIGIIRKMVEHAKASEARDPDKLFSLN